MPLRVADVGWNRRPNGPVQINWANPLARGLRHYWPLSGEIGGRDLARGEHLTRSGLAQVGSPVGGSVFQWGGTGSDNFSYVPAYGGNPYSFTLSAWVTIASDFNGVFVGRTPSDGYQGWILFRDGTTNGLAMYWTGGIDTKTTDTLNDFNRPTHIAVTIDGVGGYNGQARLYVNGKQPSQSGTTTLAGASTYDGTAVTIGRRPYASDPAPVASGTRIWDVAWWHERALSPAEIWSLYDPRTRWSLYAPQIRRFALDLGGGGGPTYSLSAATESYVLSGTNINVYVTRTFAADSGSYTLSGTANNLLANRLVTGDSGTFNLTGTEASITANRLLVGGSGSFTLSGTDTVLKAARMIVGDSGTFNFTGLDVTLQYTPLTGYAPLVAESGTFVLSGTDITLKASRNLAADSGTFNLTGTNADLSRRYTLTAIAGDFVLTANNVTFGRSYVLSSGIATYTLTGTNATLRYSGQKDSEAYIRLESPFTNQITSLLSGTVPLSTLTTVLSKLSEEGNVTVILTPDSPNTGDMN